MLLLCGMAATNRYQVLPYGFFVVVFLKMLESQKNQLGMYIQNVYEISQRDIRASKDLVCPMVCIQSC